jgi:poly(hydroxyalkanoate) granule-associated protein
MSNVTEKAEKATKTTKTTKTRKAAKGATEKVTTRQAWHQVEALGKDAAETGRNVWLAGLGVVAEAETQGKDLFENLVKKGETFEARYKKGLDETVDNAGERLKKAREWFETKTDRSLGGASDVFTRALHRFGVPTHEDIRTLSQRVETLTEKVEAIGAK